LEKLHNIFFQAPFSKELSLDLISSDLELTRIETVNIVVDLIQNSVIEWESFRCEKCDKEITKPLIRCDTCGNDVAGQWRFHVDGCIPEQNQEKYKAFSGKSAEAKRFASKLSSQGYMYYLLLDLVESENLQEKDGFQYNDFLEKIRTLIQQEALSQAKDDVLCLGEIGDCLKLAFLSADDFIEVLEKFAETIRKEELDKQFPLLKAKEAAFFPRYDGLIGKITILPRYRTDLKKIFCVTLNGAIDFNDYEVTRLFRFDKEIKTCKEIFEGDTVLSVWTENQIFKDIGWEEMPTINVTVNSHGKDKDEIFGLMVYTGHEDNPYTVIDKPEKYKG
jgi:hypothetical protein